ncbi:hypothetical protein BLA29_014767 [Euroglyphus maynei]|uniref:Uncharacterized protein n=1 Tax=Euroglyphus maynei TaxID=6958 RepID=A0A1Y3B9D4_EURMA|nr:hypothetical protein BLA29_014767 [Euroglyphus maynei]
MGSDSDGLKHIQNWRNLVKEHMPPFIKVVAI